MSDCRKCVDFDWCVEHEGCGLFRQKPQTNYDILISKTPEELAEWFGTHACCMRDPFFCTKPGGCKKCWLEWLKQEAT